MIHNFNNFSKINEMSDTLIKFKMPIGDWSDDGHGEFLDLAFQSNTPIDVLQQGYKDSCRKLGLQFNDNTDYTGLISNPSFMDKENRWRMICTEYGEYTIKDKAKEILSQHIPDFDSDKFFTDTAHSHSTPEQFAELILNFIKISVPEFEWEEAATTRSEIKNLPTLNGYWNKELNHQFGYGLFDIN